jgi:hypothetical protein
MTRLVVAGVVGVGLAATVGWWIWDMGRELHRRAELIAGLVDAQDHRPCIEIIGNLEHERAATLDYARRVERRLDGDLDDELARLINEEGGGP